MGVKLARRKKGQFYPFSSTGKKQFCYDDDVCAFDCDIDIGCYYEQNKDINDYEEGINPPEKNGIKIQGNVEEVS